MKIETIGESKYFIEEGWYSEKELRKLLEDMVKADKMYKKHTEQLMRVVE